MFCALNGPVFFALSMPGMGEWGVILIIVLLLFGGKNVPDLARTLGNGVREFKRAVNGIGGSDDGSGPDPGSGPGSDNGKSGKK